MAANDPKRAYFRRALMFVLPCGHGVQRQYTGQQIAKILIAASPEPRAIVERVVADHELFFAETLVQALKLLSERTFDLIICTIAFDESKMFELLGFAKSTPAWKSIPFVCARVRTNVVRSPSALAAAAFTSRQLGAAAFLDIADYQVDPERGMREAIDGVLETTSRTAGR